MLTHVVCFKFSDFAEAGEATRRLLALMGRVPSLKGMEAGVDVVRSDRSYDVAVVARFDDLAGLEAYRVHPIHQEVVEFVRARATASVAVDFES